MYTVGVYCWCILLVVVHSIRQTIYHLVASCATTQAQYRGIVGIVQRHCREAYYRGIAQRHSTEAQYIGMVHSTEYRCIIHSTDAQYRVQMHRVQSTDAYSTDADAQSTYAQSTEYRVQMHRCIDVQMHRAQMYRIQMHRVQRTEYRVQSTDAQSTEYRCIVQRDSTEAQYRGIVQRHISFESHCHLLRKQEYHCCIIGLFTTQLLPVQLRGIVERLSRHSTETQ